METLFDADVCVIGTGAAGGILAHQLAKSGLKVISLEQGPQLGTDHFKSQMPVGVGTTFGVGPDTVWPADPHDSLFIHPLFANGQQGSTARPPDGFRHFQVLAVNGLQNLWNGVSVRFSSNDMRDWPVHYDTLEPHYTATEKLITVCGTREGIEELPDGEFIEPKPLRPADQIIIDAVRKLNEPWSHAIANRKAINTRTATPSSCVSTGVCTSGCPVGAVYKFSTRLLPEIRALANYKLVPDAKVVSLVRSPGSATIESIQYLSTITGQRHSIRPRMVVVSAGAIETPRILFNSADADSPTGLGNQGGQLGAGLQDNPKVVLSTSLRRLWGKRRNYDIGYGDLLILMSRATLPDGTPFPFIGHSIHGLPDYPHYLHSMQNIPALLKQPLARMLFHSYVTLGLFCAGERRPENRVRMGNTIDAYGVPQVAIDFQVPPSAHAMMDAMMAWGRKVLGNASATQLYCTRDNNGTGIHYAGTTAMGTGPENSVVDANLKVHGMSNLFVCDGGVIPHLPDKHLTLTIMALAHRLSEHIVRMSAT